MGTLDEKIELFKARLLTETLRQWVMLVILSFLFFLILYSLIGLVRTYRKLISADTIMLSLIQMRIVFFLKRLHLVKSDFTTVYTE